MPQTWASLQGNIVNILQDAASAVASSGDINYRMIDALREIGAIIPYVVPVSYTIESRTGQASSTSAGNLIDTTEGQFASGDVGKTVYNVTEKKWATVTGYTSTSQIAVSNDVFTVNDSYKVFNKECVNNKQLNISDVTDYIDVKEAEYPIGTKRSIVRISQQPDIIALDMSREPDDSKALTSGNEQPETEVLVYFQKRHKVSQLTDLAGAIAATCVAGATTLSLKSLQSAGTIEADQEFTIADVHGTYWVKEDSTIATNTAAIIIYPPMPHALASSGQVVTFKLSTLIPQLEPVYCQYVAGKVAINDTMTYYQQINSSITTLAAATTAIASVAGQISAATAQITSGTASIASATTLIAAATTEFALINAEIDKASTAMTAGYAIINTVPVGGGVSEYMGQAQVDVSVGRGYLVSGQGILEGATANGKINDERIRSASASLNAAAASLSEGMGNLRLVSSRLAVATGGRTLEAWGRQTMNEALSRLRQMQGVRASRQYSRG